MRRNSLISSSFGINRRVDQHHLGILQCLDGDAVYVGEGDAGPVRGDFAANFDRAFGNHRAVDGGATGIIKAIDAPSARGRQMTSLTYWISISP